MDCDAALGIILRDCRVLMIRRSASFRDPFYWNIGFPGGNVERGDEGCLGTAIREVSEEVGIELGKENLIGELPIISPLSVRLRVKPYLFMVDDGVSIKVGSEVESARWLDMRKLKEGFALIPSRSILVRALYCCDYVIWGMSYRLLKIVLHMLCRAQQENFEEFRRSSQY